MSTWLTLLGPPLFILCWIAWYCLQPDPTWNDEGLAEELSAKEAAR